MRPQYNAFKFQRGGRMSLPISPLTGSSNANFAQAVASLDDRDGKVSLSGQLMDKYRYMLGRVERYDDFVSDIVRRFGVVVSTLRLPSRVKPVYGVQRKPMEVTYIRKPMADEGSAAEVIAGVMPSIVQVRGWSSKSEGWAGSGAIIALSDAIPGGRFPPNSYAIITNHHVTPDSTKFLSVTLPDGTALNDVRVLGSLKNGAFVKDEPTDSSIIFVQSETPLPTLPLAKELPKEGEIVLAIGHPFGMPRASVTRGVVSRGAQETGAAVLVIQHDAAINPGNSGGPVINMRGEVLGLNTFSFRDADNVSFAYPIQTQMAALREIYFKGEFVRGDFGFSVAEFSQYERHAKNFPPKIPGAEVEWVDYGSSADNAGIKAGDIVTKIIASDGSELSGDGINIDNPFEVTRFISYMHERAPGAAIRMVVLRYDPEGDVVVDGKKYPYKLIKVELPVAKLKPVKTELESEEWGFVVKTHPSSGRLVITDVRNGSPAFEAGIRGGRWILAGIAAKSVSDKPIQLSDMETLKQILIQSRDSDEEEVVLGLASAADPNGKTFGVKLKRRDVERFISKALHMRQTEIDKAA